MPKGQNELQQLSVHYFWGVLFSTPWQSVRILYYQTEDHYRSMCACQVIPRSTAP